MGCLRESCSLPVDKLWRLCVMTQCALPLPRAKQPLTFANPHYLKTQKQNMISSLFTHRRGCIAARKPCGWVIVGGGINNLSEERYRRGTTERRYIAAPSGTVCPQQIDLTQFTAWGHINPITTELVFMVFIEAGAFAGPQHLGHFCAQPQSLPRRFRHFSADNISASESTLHKEDEDAAALPWGHWSICTDEIILLLLLCNYCVIHDVYRWTRINAAKVKVRAHKSQNPVHGLGLDDWDGSLSQCSFCGWFQSLFYISYKMYPEIKIEWRMSNKQICI